MSVAFDYLIVSDLHLRGGFNNPTAGLYHFDEEFADFLRYYRLHRAADRCWRLIISGDFIEFLYITDLPDPNERLMRGVSFPESEQRYGPGTEAPKSRWKLDRILRASHPQLLLALARFVAEGNEVILLRGNHDLEMSWPEVQDHFRRLIAEHHPEDFSYMAMKEAVAQRVQFPLWFWCEPGLLYVEHGCQYDPFCATEHVLNPLVPESPTHMQLSIAELAIRYFTNQMKTIDAMAAENIMSVSEYIGWVVGGNLKILPRVASLYGGMIRRVLAKSGQPNPQAERSVREENERRIAAVDEKFGLPSGTAAAVNAMRASPVMRSALATARFLALDLIVFGGLLAAAVAGILIWYPARTGLLALVAAATVMGSIIYVGALRFRRIAEAAQLRHTAERIAALFKVQNVIFGHSHAAGTWPLPTGGQYINVGTWVPMGEDAYFVYFAATSDGPNWRASLWRWNKRKKEPEPFEKQ
jgi:UDP-2,3-diacylglucosamine pyrophosphatase LpxH